MATGRTLSKAVNQPATARMKNSQPTLYIFDIETIAVSSELLEKAMPADIAEPKLPYDLEKPTPPIFHNKTLAKGKAPDAEAKHEAWKAEKMEEWRDAHKAKIDKWNAEQLEKKLKWIDTACLRAETANIPLICVHEPGGTIVVFFIGELGEINMPEVTAVNPVKMMPSKQEKWLLRKFFDYVAKVLEADISAKFAGWNSSRPGGFDLAMIMRRSWINGVKVDVATYGERGYTDGSIWLDLMEKWQCGDRQLYAGADAVARALGCTVRKTDHGGNFGKKWAASKTEAIMYCMVDVLCEREISEKIGYSIEDKE